MNGNGLDRRKCDAPALDAIRAESYRKAVDDCLVIARRLLSAEWSGNELIRQLERLKK